MLSDEEDKKNDTSRVQLDRELSKGWYCVLFILISPWPGTVHE